MRPSRSPTMLALRRIRKNRLAMLGALWVLFVVVMAVTAGVFSEWTNHPRDFQLVDHKNLPPTWMDYDESQSRKFEIDPLDIEDFPELYAHNHLTYWFGTDLLGRDLFVRVLYGARISLTVAAIGTLVALVIGVIWGAVAGFFGGWLDEVMMRIVDILYALPYIFFVILIMTIFGQEEVLMFICIGAISWLTMARIVRGEVKSLKEREFMLAATALGASRRRRILMHIVPNVLGIVIVYATLMVPQLILTETFLSFLGLGIQPPKPSWGNLIQEGASITALESYPWQMLFPGITLSLTLLALNFLGDGLRDAFDPKTAA